MSRKTPPVAHVFAAILSLILFSVAHGLLTYQTYSAQAFDAGVVCAFTAFGWTAYWLTELADQLFLRRMRRRGR